MQNSTNINYFPLNQHIENNHYNFILPNYIVQRPNIQTIIDKSTILNIKNNYRVSFAL